MAKITIELDESALYGLADSLHIYRTVDTDSAAETDVIATIIDQVQDILDAAGIAPRFVGGPGDSPV